MKFWNRLKSNEIKRRVVDALSQNADYRSEMVLGIPASVLDREEFYPDAPFLSDAPFLKTLIENPNHIGCHTMGKSEKFFSGTHELEREVIALAAEKLLDGEGSEFDGYVASGGTEANIEALWIYRNQYKREFGATPSEIAVVYSEDTHYSLPKGVDLLGLSSVVAKVDDETRIINPEMLAKQLEQLKEEGFRYLVVNLNMGTTMFGSADDIDAILPVLKKSGLEYRIHVDGAYGGFVYPFTNPNNRLSFANEEITSISLDAHKMAQAPYGTGIFLIRKGNMQYVFTEEANYVDGKDCTLIGSRSGANAVAVWMLLYRYGSQGWIEKVETLNARTDSLCDRLESAGVRFYRNPFMNIVTIRAEGIDVSVAKKFNLVPDSHEDQAQWWKIVVMDHVSRGQLDRFCNEAVPTPV